jgi:hypothetical protein
MTETMPKNRDELRDFMARVVYDTGESAKHLPWEKFRAEMPQNSWLAEAETILSALDKAGLAIVPKEPTIEMIRASDANQLESAAHSYGSPPATGEEWSVMLSASPYSVKP